MALIPRTEREPALRVRWRITGFTPAPLFRVWAVVLLCMGALSGCAASLQTQPPAERIGHDSANYESVREAFIIFFGSGAFQPDDRAMGTLGLVASLLVDNPALGVSITGHTDTSGSGKVNESLAIRRARAVRRVLLNSGIAPERIHSHGAGQRRLLVETGDGVPEPRNRRVEILLSPMKPL